MYYGQSAYMFSLKFKTTINQFRHVVSFRSYKFLDIYVPPKFQNDTALVAAIENWKNYDIHTGRKYKQVNNARIRINTNNIEYPQSLVKDKDQALLRELSETL